MSKISSYASFGLNRMDVKLVVIGLTGIEERAQTLGERIGFGAIGLKAGGFVDIVIPVFCPDTVFGTRAGFPCEHRRIKGQV